jgi:hypothetical protein
MSSSDCTGNHKVLSREVRPWQDKPDLHRDQKAREPVKAPASVFHQGEKP